MLNTIQVVLVQGSCWEVLYNKQYITQQLLSKQHKVPAHIHSSTKVSHSIAQQASLMIPANKGSLDLKVSFQPLTVFALVSAPFLQLLYSFSQLKLTGEKQVNLQQAVQGTSKACVQNQEKRWQVFLAPIDALHLSSPANGMSA